MPLTGRGRPPVGSSASRSSRPSDPAVRLDLLGGFALRDERLDGRSFDLSRAQQRVLAFVALADGPTPRRQLAFVLWPDLPAERARSSLRTALYRVRLAVDDVIEGKGDRVQLGSRVACDVRVLLDWTDHVIERNGVHTLRPGVRFGELLPDLDGDWIVIERERLRQRVLHAYESLAGALLDQGRYADAVEAALAAVGIDPLRESANRALVAAHLAEGNVADALRHYDRFAQRLETDLSIAPTAALTSLVRQHRRPIAEPTPRIIQTLGD